VDNVGEGVIAQLWEAGYQTIKDILYLSTSNLEKLDGFGNRKADIVYSNIQSKIKNVELSKLQHASGIFSGLGSKKLLLLEQFNTKPSLNEVLCIEGFAETSAKIYLDGYDAFNDFLKDLPIITIKSTELKKATSSELDGKSFCFTGVRLADEELKIIDKGGKISSGVSKTLTYIVCKDKNAGSAKLIKAEELGVILLSVEDLKGMLK
jgi:NAD-dependent DNA ligase